MLRFKGSRLCAHFIQFVQFRFVCPSVRQSACPSVRLSVRPVAVCRPERCSPAVVPYLLFFAVPFCLALTLITNDGALFSLAPSLALVPGPAPSPSPLPAPLCESFVCQSCQCRRPLDCIECGSICIVKALARAQAGAAGAYSLAYT